MPTIDDIVRSRDDALAALETAFNEVGNEIARTVTPGRRRTKLREREQVLADLRDAIRRTATDLVLALPEVIAAAAMLNSLSAQMKATAAELPAAADLLTDTATILALGQQFADLLEGDPKNKKG